MRDKKTLILYILAGITTVAIISLAALSFFFLKADVIVVDFSEKTVIEIEQWAKENKVEVDYEYRFDEEIARGKVISQSVEPQAKIKSKEILYIVISMGADPELEITLPDFTGFTYTQVVAFVEENKLSDVTFEYVENDEIEVDIFISHNVTTPTMKRSDMIIFTMSLGKNNVQKEIIVPDFSTYSRNQITNWGSVNNVIIKFVTTTSTTVEKDGFIRQSPLAGAITYEKRTITITYSSGLPIQAIDLSGKTKIQVVQWLDSIDNRVNISYVEKYDNSVAKNIVISNRPNSGYLADGATITVDLSLGKPNMPDYINQLHTSIVSKVNDLNKNGANIKLVSTTDYSDIVDKGKVISQDKSGDLDVGTTINVVYSLGRRITLVSQIGKTFSEFNAYLTSSKLLVGTKTERYHDTFANNTIITHTPAGGEIVYEGASLNYTLSLGAYLPEIFTGKTFTYAENVINAANAKSAGWTINRIDDFNDQYSKGIVYNQSVSSKVLTIFVSRGVGFVVGNYIGLDVYDLPNNIDGVTFRLISAGKSDSYLKNEIIQQNKTIGERYELPLVIDITYSLGPMATMPDLDFSYDSNGKSADQVLSEVTSLLSGLGFTDLTNVKKQNPTGQADEEQTPGTIWHQTTPGEYSKDYPVVVYIKY